MQTHTRVSMKIKITIIGPRVHDVGYRVFLMKHATNLGLDYPPTTGMRMDSKR